MELMESMVQMEGMFVFLRKFFIAQIEWHFDVMFDFEGMEDLDHKDHQEVKVHKVYLENQGILGLPDQTEYLEHLELTVYLYSYLIKIVCISCKLEWL